MTGAPLFMLANHLKYVLMTVPKIPFFSNTFLTLSWKIFLAIIIKYGM